MRVQSQFIFFIVAILLLILVEVSVCSSSDLHNIDEWSSQGSSKSTGVSSGLWFGPRMGRRLKRTMKEANSVGSYNNKDQLNYITELLQGEPWPIITTNGKRQMKFTPRLGRESDEETGGLIGNSDRWLQDNDVSMGSGDMMARSPPFAPRLGRRLWAQFI